MNQFAVCIICFAFFLAGLAVFLWWRVRPSRENKIPAAKGTGRRHKLTLADKLNGIVWSSINRYEYRRNVYGIQMGVLLWGLFEIGMAVVFIIVDGMSGYFGVMVCLNFSVVIIGFILFFAIDPYSSRECENGILLTVLYFLFASASAIMLVLCSDPYAKTGRFLAVFIVVPGVIAWTAFDFFTKMLPLCQLGEQFEEVSKLIISPNETERLKAFDDLYALLPAYKTAESKFIKAVEKSGDEVLVKRAKVMEEKLSEPLHVGPKLADLDL
jgi:hypothetical protein